MAKVFKIRNKSVYSLFAHNKGEGIGPGEEGEISLEELGQVFESVEILEMDGKPFVNPDKGESDGKKEEGDGDGQEKVLTPSEPEKTEKSPPAKKV